MRKSLPILTIFPPYSVKTSVFSRWTQKHPVTWKLKDHPGAAESKTAFERLIVLWCVENECLRMDGSSILLNIAENTNTLTSQLVALDFRAMVRADRRDRILAFLAQDAMETVTARLMDLATLLPVEVDPAWLDIYLNRVYQGLNALDVADADMSWADIHKRWPWLWVLFAIRQQLRRRIIA